VKASSFDAILVGQAFHWFKFDITLAEISRALKPGGGLAIIWYRRKKPQTAHRMKMDELVKRYNPDYKPGFMDYDWREILTAHGRFADIKDFAAECVYKYNIQDYLKLQRSKSYIGDAIPMEALAKFMAEAESMLTSMYPDNIVPEEMQFYYVSATKV